MNFLFVDRIIALTPGKETLGLKYVTPRDVYVTRYGEQPPVLFPCVIGEALGQLCSWNVLKACDFRFRPVGGVIQSIEMHQHAHVGETILLESHIESLDVDNQMVCFSGQATVQGKMLLTIKNSLAPLMPLEEFNDPIKVQADFSTLYKPDEDIAVNFHCTTQNIPAYKIAYDEIITWNKGVEVVAQKNVLLEAPYFSDHFPRKPVLPLSLLMEYNLQLAYDFINEQRDGKSLTPAVLRKVKIGNFVSPGDSVLTRITVKEQQPDRCIVQFHNTVENKKVCVGEAEYCSR